MNGFRPIRLVTLVGYLAILTYGILGLLAGASNGVWLLIVIPLLLIALWIANTRRHLRLARQRRDAGAPPLSRRARAVARMS